jgi:hypothetical protein
MTIHTEVGHVTTAGATLSSSCIEGTLAQPIED